MRLTWQELNAIVRDLPLPAALVDLEALENNIAATSERFAHTGKTMRVATKSLRHIGLLRRILALGGEAYQGLMCFSVDEAVFLGTQGFDDLFVAYPTVQGRALGGLARAVGDGLTAWVVADCQEHIDALGRAGREHGVEMAAIVEVDLSFRPAGGRVHLGVRRSPIRTAEVAVELARYAASVDGVRVRGVMGYEAHIAGLADASPFTSATNPVRRLLKRAALSPARELRAAVVDALQVDGHEVSLVNGGGTGSVHLTAQEPDVTEVTAGSGFLCSHLFDYFADFELEPALCFALEVCRRSDPGMVTCAGGGYVASGEPGWDRLPLPWLPAGLAYVPLEGAGEVQTPLTTLGSAIGASLRLGDAVFFRPAKAGEPAERFARYHLVRGGQIEATEPTYRGQGACFF